MPPNKEKDAQLCVDGRVRKNERWEQKMKILSDERWEDFYGSDDDTGCCSDWSA
jgi:hypothetical protein